MVFYCISNMVFIFLQNHLMLLNFFILFDKGEVGFTTSTLEQRILFFLNATYIY